MAPPTKRKSNGKADTTTENNNTKRATRSSARLASQGITNPVVEAVPKTKKAKLTSKDKKPETKAKATEAPLAPAPKAKATEAPLAPAPKTAKVGNGAKTVVIEHCKQCTQFKIRAVKVKDALEKSVSGITVLVNPEKDMKRPFAPMKALDMDAVISEIVDQVK